MCKRVLTKFAYHFWDKTGTVGKEAPGHPGRQRRDSIASVPKRAAWTSSQHLETLPEPKHL